MGQMWGTKETSMISMTSNLQLSSCMKRKQNVKVQKDLRISRANNNTATSGTEGTTEMAWRKYEAFSY